MSSRQRRPGITSVRLKWIDQRGFVKLDAGRPGAHTRKKSHCCLLSRVRVLNGLGALFIGGTSVGTRVIRYLAAPPTVRRVFSSGALSTSIARGFPSWDSATVGTTRWWWV